MLPSSSAADGKTSSSFQSKDGPYKRQHYSSLRRAGPNSGLGSSALYKSLARGRRDLTSRPKGHGHSSSGSGSHLNASMKNYFDKNKLDKESESRSRAQPVHPSSSLLAQRQLQDPDNGGRRLAIITDDPGLNTNKSAYYVLENGKNCLPGKTIMQHILDFETDFTIDIFIKGKLYDKMKVHKIILHVFFEGVRDGFTDKEIT